MDGFQGFKFWVALRKHFTEKNFDAFQNKGRMKGSFETYLKRSDYPAIEYVASRFEPREFVLYLASNFIYGNQNAVWDYGQGVANYNLFIGRRKQIGRVIVNDLQTLKNYNIKLNDGVSIIRLLTKSMITIETVITINHVYNLTNQLRRTPAGNMLEPLLIRIDKSFGFIKTPEQILNKIKTILENYGVNV